MNAKRITLAIAILSTLGTLLSAVSGVLSPHWALLVGAVGAGCYGLVRTFQKVKEGASWKAVLQTTEAWGAALVVVASIVSAIAGVVSPERAAAVAAVAGVLLKVARMLQAANLEGAPKTTDKAGPAALVLLVSLSASSAHAHPSSSVTGEPSKWKFGPSVAAAVAAVDVRSGDYYAGANALPLGACFGATYLPVSFGADACFNVQFGSTESVRYFPSLMLHWRDWVNAGFGVLGQKADGAMAWRPLLLLGGRLGLMGG